ncbi:Rieske (2Fe-2S) protein [filamentous cyanobacterium LEGE 11480]|uniref:Rieske (2Fe-2S) protein n=1 Tax=Romeriopsis navalis LEGE 11480 TaxID=2777977 RepID=A0A928VJI9_9CYAN|nr:Rieske (2Fe-2S) protein [Romeriopsis navalis]MBE9029788.1 Rieske (2Fe-2S) protein [Romeriopsis navalis LEGE 11480]
MERREFMSWAGTGFIAASLPMAIAACSSSTTEKPDAATSTSPEPKADAKPDAAPAAKADADGFIPVGTVADLDKAGFLSDKKFAGGPLIVVRDPQDKATVLALNSTCTHEACAVRWRSEKFACACHGSSFAPDGAVEAGPAEKPLAKFTAKIAGDQVLVKA